MNTSIVNKAGDVLENSLLQENPFANIGRSERLLSVGAGAFIALKGVSNIFSHPLIALGELGIGGALLYRGITGYCAITDMAENSNAAMDDAMIEIETETIERLEPDDI